MKCTADHHDEKFQSDADSKECRDHQQREYSTT